MSATDVSVEALQQELQHTRQMLNAEERIRRMLERGEPPPPPPHAAPSDARVSDLTQRLAAVSLERDELRGRVTALRRESAAASEQAAHERDMRGLLQEELEFYRRKLDAVDGSERGAGVGVPLDDERSELFREMREKVLDATLAALQEEQNAVAELEKSKRALLDELEQLSQSVFEEANLLCNTANREASAAKIRGEELADQLQLTRIRLGLMQFATLETPAPRRRSVPSSAGPAVRSVSRLPSLKQPLTSTWSANKFEEFPPANRAVVVDEKVFRNNKDDDDDDDDEDDYDADQSQFKNVELTQLRSKIDKYSSMTSFRADMVPVRGTPSLCSFVVRAGINGRSARLHSQAAAKVLLDAGQAVRRTCLTSAADDTVADTLLWSSTELRVEPLSNWERVADEQCRLCGNKAHAAQHAIEYEPGVWCALGEACVERVFVALRFAAVQRAFDTCRDRETVHGALFFELQRIRLLAASVDSWCAAKCVAEAQAAPTD